MVSLCSSTLINIGTLSDDWIESMLAAAKKAHEIGKHWVLDPVGAGASKLRLNTISQLLEYHPSVIRGNASEILAVAGTVSNGRGVDSTDSSDTALESAKYLAKKYHCVVGITGEVDYVTDGDRTISSLFSIIALFVVHNGVEMCTLITAAGCSLTSIICAFLGIGIQPLEATVFVRCVVVD